MSFHPPASSMIRSFLGATPRYDGSNFIADSAEVIGDVRLGEGASIWFNAVVRGDVNWIEIGAATNVQDGAIIHVTHQTAPTRIGDRVTIGHGAIVHGCTVDDRVLIGMGATILDHAVIGTGSIIGARALVTQRQQVPPRSLVLGVPAQVVRQLTDAEVKSIDTFAENYLKYSAVYRGVWTPDVNPFYQIRDC